MIDDHGAPRIEFARIARQRSPLMRFRATVQNVLTFYRRLSHLHPIKILDS